MDATAISPPYFCKDVLKLIATIFSVNCNSDNGEYAESDNPETWTTFDNALKYLREKGGTTIAYALDGKDKIACLDFDECYDENRLPNETLKEALSKCGATYTEHSLSGEGFHILGKTDDMDLRTFKRRQFGILSERTFHRNDGRRRRILSP